MNQDISILGCGWLGKPLALKLIELGFIIKGSTTSKAKLQEFSQVNIAPFLINLETLGNNLNEFLNSKVLIIALPSKNIDGFRNLISNIEKSTIKKVVFISSTSVYSFDNTIVNEDTQLTSSPLLEIETLFRENPTFKTTIVRFAGLFGYNRKPGNFFKNGRQIANPDGYINMIHQDDCVSILIKLIKNEIWGETLNACADTHPKRRAFYIKTTSDIGNQPPVFSKTENIKFKIVSNKKLKSILNFEFKYNDLMNIDYGKLDN